MSRMILESELPADVRAAFEEAISPLAECDLPLVAELLFVSEEEIRDLNRRERGVDAVTDVLSFPAEELAPGAFIDWEEHGESVEADPEEGDRLYLGSVVICTERAKEQAEEYGHSLAREIGYLTVHGILHCLGYDHQTEEERKVMRAAEEEVMNKLHLRRDE